MSLLDAVDRLYESGWAPVSGRQLFRLEDGRLYPSPAEVVREFQAASLQLTIQHVSLFNCHRAEWTGRNEQFSGFCVGGTEQEAAVYALAQLIRLPAIAASAAHDATMLGI